MRFIPLRSAVTAALSIAVCALIESRAIAADAPAAAAPTAAPVATAAAKAPELFRLKNEDLIKQAMTVYETADSDYRAQLRDLATVELLLAESRKKIAALKTPPVPTTAQAPTPQAVLDAAKARQTAVTEALKLAQEQKALLDKVAAACDACQSAETAFTNALDEVRPYAVEMTLRVADGTLTADKLPMKPDSLTEKQAELQEAHDKRQARLAELVKEHESAAKAVARATKDSLAADADMTQASAAVSAGEKSEQLKKQYADKKPDELAAELNTLAEEGIGLKGAFELGLSRFNAGAAQADKLRADVAAIKQPEVKIPQLARPEDVEQAAAATQQIITFYNHRTKALEDLNAALAEVVRLGAEFNADATVSSEHLFKMRTLAELIKAAAGASTAPATGASTAPATGAPVQLSSEAQPDKVLAAAQRESKEVALVEAAVERAKTDGQVVEKRLAEARANADTAVEQLARLKQSQSATLAVIEWEGKIKGMTADQAIEAFSATSKSLQEKLAAQDKQQAAYAAALAAAGELTTKFEGLKDPLLRAAEEAMQSEKAKILGELRKEAGLERVEPAPPPIVAKPDAAVAKPADEAEKKPAPVEKKPEPAGLEKAIAGLGTFQQLVSGRLRVLEDRDIVGKDLLAAIAALSQANDVYSKALAETRQLAMQLHTSAVNLKMRIGKGEITGEKIPAGLSDALRPDLLTRLDTEAAGLLASESQFKQKKEALEKRDPSADAGKTLTKDVLSLIGQRLDLLSDLHRLDAAYTLPEKDRDPGETKRLEEEAAEREAGESSFLDTVLSIDSSKRAKSLSDLLDSDYRELIVLELKEDNLRQQREKAQQLVDLTQKEKSSVEKLLPLLKDQMASLAAAEEEESVLARIRLKPEQGDELIAAFKARTGRLLAKPVPVGEKEKADKVVELANSLFEKTVQVAAARDWQNALDARLIPTGLAAEAGAYQDEVARMNTSSGANVRRLEALTGQDLPQPGSKEAGAISARQKLAATGGSISNTRRELTTVRRSGVIWITIKVVALLLGAWLLPKLIMPMIRHSMRRGNKTDEHGNTELLLAAVGVFVKTAVWIVAVAMILSALGVDVTAIIAGLGIGGLAIGLAAQPMISDVISAVIIFAERKFTIGDVIKIGGDDPAKVVGLSWRGTQLRGSDGQAVNVPNRNITSAVVRNLTKEGRTFDSLTINVTTEKSVDKVMQSIKKAVEECKYLASDTGYTIKEYQHKGASRSIKYQFWWYLRDYDLRNKTRDEVFAQISNNLSGEEMKGTEVTLA